MNFLEHDCLLFQYFKKENIVDEYIDSGIFISTRRRLKRFIMINDKHPYCQKYIQSNAARKREQGRHLLNNPCMIHPFSLASLFIDFFIFGVLLLWYFLIPIDIAYNNYMALSIRYIITAALNFLYSAYIIMTFFIGYYDNNKNKVIVTPHLVASRYLKSYFIFDVMSVTGTYIKLSFLILGIDGSSYSFLRYLNMMKIARCFFWINVLYIIRLYVKMTTVKFLTIRLIMSYLMIWSWSCAIIFCIRHHADAVFNNESPEEVLESFYAATLVLLDVRYGLRARKTVLETISIIVFLCIGFILQVYLYAKILQLWEKHYSAKHKHALVESQLQEYVKDRAPIYMRTNVMIYLDFKFQRQFYKEKSVLNMFSSKLKEEILLHICESFLEKVEIFYQLPHIMRTKILNTLATDVFLPNDIIIKAGSVGGYMYIIAAGTVAVYTPNGKEICHLEDGSQFGEVALVFDHKRIADVIAISPCEVYRIRRCDFLEALEPFPGLKAKIHGIAKTRLSQTLHLY